MSCVLEEGFSLCGARGWRNRQGGHCNCARSQQMALQASWWRRGLRGGGLTAEAEAEAGGEAGGAAPAGPAAAAPGAIAGSGCRTRGSAAGSAGAPSPRRPAGPPAGPRSAPRRRARPAPAAARCTAWPPAPGFSERPKSHRQGKVADGCMVMARTPQPREAELWAPVAREPLPAPPTRF